MSSAEASCLGDVSTMGGKVKCMKVHTGGLVRHLVDVMTSRLFSTALTLGLSAQSTWKEEARGLG